MTPSLIGREFPDLASAARHALERQPLPGHDRYRGRFRESLKDRTLPRAIATPRAGQTEDRHRALERREQVALRRRQRHPVERLFPPRLVDRGAVLCEEVGVGQRGGQLATEYIATQLALAGAKREF